MNAPPDRSAVRAVDVRVRATELLDKVGALSEGFSEGSLRPGAALVEVRRGDAQLLRQLAGGPVAEVALAQQVCVVDWDQAQTLLITSSRTASSEANTGAANMTAIGSSPSAKSSASSGRRCSARERSMKRLPITVSSHAAGLRSAAALRAAAYLRRASWTTSSRSSGDHVAPRLRAITTATSRASWSSMESTVSGNPDGRRRTGHDALRRRTA